jgi:hypothetical protein
MLRRELHGANRIEDRVQALRALLHFSELLDEPGAQLWRAPQTRIHGLQKPFAPAQEPQLGD